MTAGQPLTGNVRGARTREDDLDSDLAPVSFRAYRKDGQVRTLDPYSTQVQQPHRPRPTATGNESALTCANGHHRPPCC